ncbi:MAG TPA: zonular occludens toxin domain-containing protein [Cellvibrio sp.]
MIVFHEGLPGSGKSYEACVMHILPALKAGRDVITNINGINHEKFSELTSIPVAVLKKMLVCISHSDCDDEEQRLELVKADFFLKTKKDSMVVIDEIQDMFPTKRQPVTPEWSKWIASHRHEGLDIVLMGQDRRDVHPIWRRRIQRLLTFNKLQAVGADSSYRWVCLEATSPEKFKEVSSGVRRYDKQYFGLYASHTQGTENKSVYKDNRANILKNKNLQAAVIAFIFLAWYGISHTIAFFNPQEKKPIAKTEPENHQPQNPHTVTQVNNKPEAKPAEPVAEKEPERPSLDIFDQEARRGRLRLAALLYTKEKIYFRIEIMDSYNRLLASYDYRSLVDLGWEIQNRDSGIHLIKANQIYVARPWQLENSYAQVDRRQVQSLGQ